MISKNDHYDHSRTRSQLLWSNSVLVLGSVSEARSGTLTLPYCNHVVAVDVTASTQLAA